VTDETHVPNPVEDLEEAAQGQELYRAPGRHVLLDQAKEGAEAAGWLPSEVADEWPQVVTRRQITERRIDLYDAMQRLEAAGARAIGRPRWAEDMREALENLDRALQRHVTEIETNGGLFSEVLTQAPHLAPVIEDLREEHEELIRRCRAALEIVDVWGRDAGSDLRRRVLGILGRLALHRQNGAELLYDAFNVDLATGD
jgi:hypothetical protein